MTEHPIIFNGPMVRATLEGRKTQTRRVIKPQLHGIGPSHWYSHEPEGWWTCGDNTGTIWRCPYGLPSDRLWVREMWQVGGWDELLHVQRVNFRANDTAFIPNEPESSEVDDSMNEWCGRTMDELIAAGYEAPDDAPFNLPEGAWPVKWRPSIHMPHWASRINLEVVNIWVERVQEIMGDDFYAEGCPDNFVSLKDQIMVPQDWFRNLWDSLNAKRGLGWDANPWVWVIEFKVLA